MLRMISALLPLLIAFACGYGVREWISRRRRAAAREERELISQRRNADARDVAEIHTVKFQGNTRNALWRGLCSCGWCLVGTEDEVKRGAATHQAKMSETSESKRAPLEFSN